MTSLQTLRGNPKKKRKWGATKAALFLSGRGELEEACLDSCKKWVSKPKKSAQIDFFREILAVPPGTSEAAYIFYSR